MLISDQRIMEMIKSAVTTSQLSMIESMIHVALPGETYLETSDRLQMEHSEAAAIYRELENKWHEIEEG